MVQIPGAGVQHALSWFTWLPIDCNRQCCAWHSMACQPASAPSKLRRIALSVAVRLLIHRTCGGRGLGPDPAAEGLLLGGKPRPGPPAWLRQCSEAVCDVRRRLPLAAGFEQQPHQLPADMGDPPQSSGPPPGQQQAPPSMLSIYLQSTGQLPPGQQLASPRLGEASPRQPRQAGYLQQAQIGGQIPSASVPIASQRSLGLQGAPGQSPSAAGQPGRCGRALAAMLYCCMQITLLLHAA
jgi:hypothetical protein